MKTTDTALLKLFAREQEEAAFTELARRYSSLIFHTALRRTGSHALAEEVSQKVLCALARKAAELALTTDDRGLGPWLHRATSLEASKAIRTESSQQRRRHLQHPDDMPATTSGTSLWDDALPHLDLALDRLGESDRSVLILHYFRRMTFREIAASTGRSVDAVQKQSVRALDKLSGLLRARGVVLSVAGLTAGLAAESAKAVPTAFISTFASQASTILPANPILVMLSTKTKILVTAVVILCAIPLVSQQLAISRATRHSTALPSMQVTFGDPLATLATGSSRQRSSRPAASPSTSSAISDQCDWKTLMDETFNDKLSPTDRAALRAKLEAMSPTDRARVMREAAGAELTLSQKSGFLAGISHSLIETDPGLVCPIVMDAFKGEPSFDHLFDNALGNEAYKEWLKQNPAAAQAWYERLKQERDQGGWGPKELVDSIQIPLFETLVRTNPDAARAMLAAEASAESKDHLMHGAFLSYIGEGEKANEERAGSGSAAAAAIYLQYLREQPVDSGDQQSMFNKMITNFADEGNHDALQAWLSLPNLTPEEKQTIGTLVALNSIHYPDKAPAMEALLKKAMPQDADHLLQQARESGK
ncbi:hypothetical protein llg_36610 [Luteolibacter sp. LG18]|nr:hypothetical protein llg_36610 [Luteolibacter sp. LG18]